MENKGYRKLLVWQKADELAYQIYIATNTYPKSELFGLISQMRRCAISVPANIVEGYARSSKKELAHFCYIARGSLTELEYYLDFSFKMKFLDEQKYLALCKLREETARLLNGYIKSL